MASETSPYLFRAETIQEREERSSHPMNPASELVGTHLSSLAGLERTGLSRVRIPPGRESFVYHRHHLEEEWVYILSGSGTAEIDDAEYPVAAGDFMAFPTPSVAHHLRNSGTEDLVYLMGGENRDAEIADFPRHGKRMVRIGTDVALYELDAGIGFEEAAD